MHRKPELIKRIGEWLELELESTCVALDQFTSVEIKKSGKRIEFIQKVRGKEPEIAQVYMDDEGVSGMVLSMPDSTAMSLMLFSLEKAIETF